MEEDGYVIVPKPGDKHDDGSGPEEEPPFFLSDIDSYIQSLESSLWVLNDFLHQNPELGFKEFKAHDALTDFLRNRNGWQVTRSAYGMETAWMAVYDAAGPGPVVSFNVEMGMTVSCDQNGKLEG